jgi:hypothetical protein
MTYGREREIQSSLEQRDLPTRYMPSRLLVTMHPGIKDARVRSSKAPSAKHAPDVK